MVRQSILKGLLILYGIYVVMIGKEIGRKEEMPEDYCSVEEFEGLDYYLFCDTQIHKDVANFESRPSIIGSGTKNIEEAGKLYQEFRKRLPLGQEGKDEEGEESNVIYVSPDCKWVVANKWSEHKSISTQELFYEKEKVREKVSEAGQGVEQILIVKDGDSYKEMAEEQYARLTEAVWIGFYDGGYGNLKKISPDGKMFIEIADDFRLLTIKKASDGTTLWNFSLEGIQEDVRKRRDDIQEEDEIMVGICQFEGNEDTGWLAVQAGPSSFFRIAYPSGDVTYIGEYMYSLCFSPDGKYAAYSDVDYDNRVGMDSEERENTPPQGIYILEMETGKTAYIYWPYEDPAQDFMEYRNFMWIEKEAFEEYMGEKAADHEKKFSCREVSEGYEVVLYGKGNAEVFSAVYPKEPEIVSVADDILEISVSTGSPSRYVFYFNSQNTKISETFFDPILIDNKYVAYMEDDRLILTDIFREGILYEEIVRDFSKMANSISAVISIELSENGDILLQYYKGEDMQIVTELCG